MLFLIVVNKYLQCKCFQFLFLFVNHLSSAKYVLLDFEGAILYINISLLINTITKYKKCRKTENSQKKIYKFKMFSRLEVICTPPIVTMTLRSGY